VWITSRSVVTERAARGGKTRRGKDQGSAIIATERVASQRREIYGEAGESLAGQDGYNR
jgi:hypothetical protein